MKYYPDEITKRKSKIQQSFQNRMNVFMNLIDLDYLEDVSLDVDKGEQIVKVLDAAVIKLEGGSDFDLLSLNNDDDEARNKDSIFAVDTSASNTSTIKDKSASNSSSNNVSSEPGINKDSDNVNKDQSVINNGDKIEDTSLVDISNLSCSNEIENDDDRSREDGEASCSPKSSGAFVNESGDNVTSTFTGEINTQDSSQKEFGAKVAIEVDQNTENKPRALHKTCSIFFRNLAPSIVRQEIEDVNISKLL